MISGALSFALGDDAFAVPLHCVEAVLRAAWPQTVARAPFGCLGLLDLRGELLPIVDTAALFALRRPLRASTSPEALVGKQFVVVSLPPVRAALLVDRVLDVAGAADEAPQTTAEARSAAAVVQVDLAELVGGARGRLLMKLAAAQGVAG